MIFKTRHPSGDKVKTLGVPVKLKKDRGQPQGPSPLLGQHTAEILQQLGYSLEDIAGMEEKKVVRRGKRKG